MRARSALAPLFLAGLAALAWRGLGGAESAHATQASASQAAPVVAEVKGAKVEADLFHPARAPGADGKRPAAPTPAYGGRATVHLERLPRTLNNVLENQGAIRRMMYELHETLLLRDWETMEWGPNLAKEWTVEDAIWVKPGAPDYPTFDVGGRRVVVGKIVGESAEQIEVAQNETTDLPSTLIFPDQNPKARRGDRGGISWWDRQSSDGKGLVQRSDVERIERGSVLSFRLRDGVRWHDGHPFDWRDVQFSLELYANPLVECGERRPQFSEIVRIEHYTEPWGAGPASTVRVWFASQSYYRLTALGSELTILPAHLYDLNHPDNVDGQKKRATDPNWKPSQAEAAEYINKNPHNRAFVGLGPYKLARFDEQGVLAERNPHYFDPSRAGYLDQLFWRFIADDGAAFQALLNGELDFFARMSADDYFGPATQSDAFTKRNYKGHFYSGNYWFTAWNLRRPQLADVRVREAIARAFDFEGFKNAKYKGLADVVTGPWMLNRPEYDKSVLQYPRDPARARALLEEAGWLDRDGDGVVDKDGVKLEIELLSDAGNAISRAFAAKLQEDLKAVGIALRYTALDSKAVDERKKKRDFDAVALAWALGFETDPEQVWHSKWAPADAKGSNFGGFADERCDRLIEAGQKELDPEKRAAIWRALHARIYELQPYLFGYSPPRKFGMNKALFGLQLVAQDPNYVLRRWYYPAGTPGTRPTLETK
ncbi:MAG: ABC transporter substrate-binding protein [Planctomycetota bacterium]